MIVNFSRRADADLVEIALWIARDNPTRARSFANELRAACFKIGAHPHAYRKVPRFGPNARRKNHGRYAIFFDVNEDHVLITAIVHGARDLDALF